MVEINTPKLENIEQIEIAGNIHEIVGVKSAHSFKGYMNSKIRHFIKFHESKYTGREIEMLLRGVLGVFENFHPETKVSVRLSSWKGKDTIEFIEKPESFDIITHQRLDQDSDVKEIKHNISKKEINAVIWAINDCSECLDKKGEKYKDTKDIAESFCKRMNITRNDKDNNLWTNGFEWGRFFSDRSLHNNLNLVLRLLDKLEIIKYRAGRSYILNKSFNFQLQFP